MTTAAENATKRRKTMRRSTITFISSLMLLVAIAVVGTTTGAKAQGQGRKARTCGLQTLKGNYAAMFNGTAFDVGPFASVGVVSFDGNGNVSATHHASFNGNPGVYTFAGTYDVDADCTGTMTTIHNPGEFEGHFYFVILDKGKEVLVIQQDPGSIFTATFKRQ
jgi:hypothetical protein